MIYLHQGLDARSLNALADIVCTTAGERLLFSARYGIAEEALALIQLRVTERMERLALWDSECQAGLA